jgi:hypothetical protein
VTAAKPADRHDRERMPVPGTTTDTTAAVATASHAEILTALPLRPRPALCIDPGRDETGHLLVLEKAGDPDEGDGIIGLAIRDECGWYLACIVCCGEIEEADSGMCRACRLDAEWQEAEAGNG